MKDEDVIIGGVAGDATSAGVYGIAASTASAAGLSGAAATSSALATIGGGAIAAGGAGILGGVAVLGGIPIVVIAGVAVAEKLSKDEDVRKVGRFGKKVLKKLF